VYRLQNIAAAAIVGSVLAVFGPAYAETNAQDNSAQSSRGVVEATHSALLNEEFSKQIAIFRSQGEAVPDGYIVDRSLLSYTFMLSVDFDHALAELTPTDRWLDIGAGKGQAILDYYTERYDAMHAQGKVHRGKKAHAVAVSIEDRRTPQWQQAAGKLENGQIRYLSGKRLRDYPREELGQFRLITDMMGGFSYTENLSRFLEQVLGLLKLNGNFYTLLQDVHAEHGKNAPYYTGSPYRTEIADTDGAEVKVCAWLKRITCVAVTCELRTEKQLPTEVYRMRKVCNDVAVPELSTVHYEAGTPPERRFTLDRPTPAQAHLGDEKNNNAVPEPALTQ